MKLSRDQVFQIMNYIERFNEETKLELKYVDVVVIVSNIQDSMEVKQYFLVLNELCNKTRQNIKLRRDKGFEMDVDYVRERFEVMVNLIFNYISLSDCGKIPLYLIRWEYFPIAERYYRKNLLIPGHRKVFEYIEEELRQLQSISVKEFRNTMVFRFSKGFITENQIVESVFLMELHEFYQLYIRMLEKYIVKDRVQLFSWKQIIDYYILDYVAQIGKVLISKISHNGIIWDKIEEYVAFIRKLYFNK